jgi:hypothetical protein
VYFTVEFYETATGNCPVREFLDDLKESDPDDFAAVVAGLAKLCNRPFLEKRTHHRDSERTEVFYSYARLRVVGASAVKYSCRVNWRKRAEP